jgi:hypothetical protein
MTRQDRFNEFLKKVVAYRRSEIVALEKEPKRFLVVEYDERDSEDISWVYTVDSLNQAAEHINGGSSHEVTVRSVPAISSPTTFQPSRGVTSRPFLSLEACMGPTTVTTFQNCTFYRPGEFMGNIIREDCRQLTITAGQKYAQHNDAVKVEYTPKGARKSCSFWLTYKPFLIVVERKEAIDPPSMFGELKLGQDPAVTLQTSRYSSFDERWLSDFLEALAAEYV